MDIHFMSDAYACIQYIVSRVKKEEREMGNTTTCSTKEVYRFGNQAANETMWTGISEFPICDSTRGCLQGPWTSPP